MSWDEEFSDRYAEWSATMTADIPFYVDLARQADGPVVELAVGNGRVGLIDVAGLRLEFLHGGFAGQAYDADSDRYVFVTRRPG